MRIPFFACLAALLALTALGLGAGADETAEVTAYAIGDQVADFTAPGLDGDEVRLSDLEITTERATKAVLEVARAYGLAEDAGLETAIRDLPGVQEEGEVDDFLVTELVGRTGRVFGLVANDERIESLASLGDVVAWIEGAKASPILVHVWSPRCPMCRNIYDEKVHEIIAAQNLRHIALAANYPDDPEEHVRPYLEGNGYWWRVGIDSDQAVTDRLGGRKTPHLFVIDAEGRLRYQGTVDNDPRGRRTDEEREDYLLDAIEAVQTGEEVEVTETEPAG